MQTWVITVTAAGKPPLRILASAESVAQAIERATIRYSLEMDVNERDVYVLSVERATDEGSGKWA